MHRDIIDIANYIKTSTSRKNIAQILHLKLPAPLPSNHEELVDASIGLTIRLLLMMNFGSLQYGFTGRTKLSWTKESLGKNMDEYLGAFRSSSCGQERVRLEKEFNACNLERIAGLQIEWTMNLADHLQLTDEENKVSIFCYASFLECQLKSTIFPKGFIAETLRTIRLLIPQTEKQTKQWFEKKCLSAPHLDQKVLKCGRLRAENRRIEDFEFWREQLVILKQYSDEAEPNTISQWWCDRRKRVQWYTFWVAMLVLSLTIFFGLIECVKGALQVYKAFNN